MIEDSQFMKDQIQYGKSPIAYRYAFSNRKNLALSVHPNLHVEVIAPENTDIDKIRQKVEKRASWIIKQQRFFEKYLPVSQPRRFVSGETHLYLGRRYRLKILEGNDTSVKLKAGRFFVTMPFPKTSDNVRQMLDDWYTKHANTIISDSIDLCLKRFVKYKIEKPEYRIRPLKRRWGHCSNSRIITLNRDLIKTPRECIHYVITHELCHLVEPNHSSRFYQILGIELPNWKEIKERLDCFGNVVS